MIVVDKPAGLVVHPGAGTPARHARAGPAGPLPGARRRRRPRPSRHRPPPRQGHVGPAARGPHRRRPTTRWSPQLAGPRGRAALPRARVGRRSTRRAAWSTRRSAARPASPPAWPCRPTGKEARTRYEVRGDVHRPGRGRRCSSAGSRPAAPTRSGCTSPPSATRSSATTATAAPGQSLAGRPAVPARRRAARSPTR